MKKMLLFTLLLLPILSVSTLEGQVDNQTWTGLHVKAGLNEKLSLGVKPIIRHFMDIGEYQNSSIDVYLKYKIGGGWKISLLGRRWFMPDRSDRQFIWPGIENLQSFKDFSWFNNFRYHLALDIFDTVDPNFLRWMTILKPHVDWPVKPQMGFELFFRTDSFNELQRLRYEPGISWSFENHYNLTVVYRRQESLNVDPGSKQNQYVITLTYNVK